MALVGYWLSLFEFHLRSNRSSFASPLELVACVALFNPPGLAVV
jgi:hypothetical protein